jgi:hypothetical protein
MLPFGVQQEPGETGSPIASKIAQRLAKNLRRFGSVAFWHCCNPLAPGFLDRYQDT